MKNKIKSLALVIMIALVSLLNLGCASYTFPEQAYKEVVYFQGQYYYQVSRYQYIQVGYHNNQEYSRGE